MTISQALIVCRAKCTKNGFTRAIQSSCTKLINHFARFVSHVVRTSHSPHEHPDTPWGRFPTLSQTNPKAGSPYLRFVRYLEAVSRWYPTWRRPKPCLPKRRGRVTTQPVAKAFGDMIRAKRDFQTSFSTEVNLPCRRMDLETPILQRVVSLNAGLPLETLNSGYQICQCSWADAVRYFRTVLLPVQLLSHGNRDGKSRTFTRTQYSALSSWLLVQI